MSDPINPDHYAGRACADIGERLSANGYQVLKYCWRLGHKDREDVELGKAAWYAASELALLTSLNCVFPGMRTQPLTQDLGDHTFFLRERLSGQPPFVCTVAKMLWRGYTTSELQVLMDLIDAQRATLTIHANEAP